MVEHITADQAAEGAGRMRVRIEATGIVVGIDSYGSCLVQLDGGIIKRGQFYENPSPLELPRMMVFPVGH